MKPKLSELALNAEDSIAALEEALEQGNLEFAEELKSHIKNLFVELSDKIDDYLFIIRKKQAEKDFYYQEAANMKAKGDSSSKAVDWLEANLINHLKQIPDYKYKGKYQIKVCKSGGRQPVDYADIPISEIPDEYVEYRPTINQQLLYQDIVDGKSPVSKSGKSLGKPKPRGFHVRIK